MYINIYIYIYLKRGPGTILHTHVGPSSNQSTQKGVSIFYGYSNLPRPCRSFLKPCHGLEQAFCHQELDVAQVFDVAQARMVVGEVWKTIPVDVSG